MTKRELLAVALVATFRHRGPPDFVSSRRCDLMGRKCLPQQASQFSRSLETVIQDANDVEQCYKFKFLLPSLWFSCLAHASFR